MKMPSSSNLVLILQVQLDWQMSDRKKLQEFNLFILFIINLFIINLFISLFFCL